MSIKSEDITPMHAPILYTGTLPDPILGCKIAPLAKTLGDFAGEPISLPEVELQYTQHFKGLHMLLNVDLVNQEAFEDPTNAATEMEEQDAALLADILALSIDEVPTAGPSPSADSLKDSLKRGIAKTTVKPITPLPEGPNIFTDSSEVTKLKKRPKIKRSKEYCESRNKKRERKK